ncbi:AAA ATPase [Candidatus Magnetobacterium bavaricum]|uniref:AAA ATPase n=1 Tax=Candidatus Magnetobacterium bavaricum TaxID=29290 RepID=A0A0F3GIP9_9BACT|nr:AAA ATPase [Candidatus Magnetobacterium bavaricum]
MNPFLDTTAYIKYADKFFGREREIKEITGRLQNKVPCSVVGPRRIGKSSLLYHFTLKDLGLSKYNPVYIDCMKVYGSPKAFLLEIFNVLGGECSESDELETLFSKLNKYLKDNTNETPLLLLDEIEAIAKPRFGDIFNWLRANTSAGALNIVTASKEELSKVFGGKDDVGSAFHNIFVTIPLGVMSESEVRAMLKTLASPEFEATCGRRIRHEVGTHPFHVQQLAALCYDKWQAKEPLDDNTWQQILAEYNSNPEVHDNDMSEPNPKITDNGRRILEYLTRYGEAKKPRIAVTLRLVPSEMQEAIMKLQSDKLVELRSTERDWVQKFGITEKGRKITEDLMNTVC